MLGDTATALHPAHLLPLLHAVSAAHPLQFAPVGQLRIDPRQLGMEFGSGAVVGGVIGFAAKKVAKILAIIVGLELALFKFLESRNIITVDWERLTAGVAGAARNAASSGEPPSWIMTILSTLSVSAGFTGGFLLGFRRG